MLPKYREWFRLFPDWRALSRASFPNVLRAWQGLGYNRRARYLKDAAEIIVRDFAGKIPSSPRILETFLGVGHYTARAVFCFALGRCEPFIETNIRRAIIHEFFPSNEKDVTDGKILMILARIEPHKRKKDWYLALMDYGADLKGRFPNPNQRGKSYVRQSRFEGSRRYVRAAIVKILLTKKHLSEQGLLNTLTLDPLIMPHIKSGKWREILATLEKNRILGYNNSQWKIAENG